MERGLCREKAGARSRGRSVAVHTDVPPERLDVLVEGLFEEIDAARVPELSLQRPRLGDDGPRAVGERFVAADPAEHETKAQLAHAVAEEEEMAAAQLGG